MPRRLAATTLVTAALLVSWTGPGTADLEVFVPPGAPTDWLRRYPGPTPTDLGQVPRNERGSVAMIRGEAFTPRGGAFGFGGIPTVDLPAHLPWSRPGAVTITDGVEITRPGSPQLRGLVYPPELGDHLYWLALATMLRTVLHQAAVSDALVREHLVLLGHPAYAAARRAVRERPMTVLAEELIERIGPPPKTAPRPLKGKTPQEQMLLSLAIRELASTHPYAPDRPFAPHLRWLGAEGITPVLACTRVKHKRVRRNATTMLGAYTDKSATVRLLELARDADPVVRNRAIVALVQRREPKVAAVLQKGLGSRDKKFAAFCADGLGRVGEGRSLDAVRRFLAKRIPDRDALWAGVAALGRIGTGSGAAAAKRLLRKVQHELGKNAKLLDKKMVFPNNWVPDTPDAVTKAEVVAQGCEIALAGMGDAAARKNLLGIIAGKTTAAGSRQARIQALETELEQVRGQLTKIEMAMRSRKGDAQLATDHRTLQRRKAVIERELTKLDRTRGVGRKRAHSGEALLRIAPANRYLVCEVLARMPGKPPHDVLLEVVRDEFEDAALRAYALQLVDLARILGAKNAAPKCQELVKVGGEGLVRAEALARLEQLDRAVAIEAAIDVVQEYLQAKPEELPSQRGWIVIPALRVLGTQGKHQVDLLLQVMAHAEKELDAAAALQAAERKKPRNKKWYLDSTRVFGVPPVLEVAILQLGRSGQPDAARHLQRRLAQGGAGGRPARGRVQCALALGALGGDGPTRALLDLLTDAEPWVRFGAYRALRKISGQDEPTCDWLYGDRSTHQEAAKGWRAWHADAGR